MKLRSCFYDYFVQFFCFSSNMHTGARNVMGRSKPKVSISLCVQYSAKSRWCALKMHRIDIHTENQSASLNCTHPIYASNWLKMVVYIYSRWNNHFDCEFLISLTISSLRFLFATHISYERISLHKNHFTASKAHHICMPLADIEKIAEGKNGKIAWNKNNNNSIFTRSFAPVNWSQFFVCYFLFYVCSTRPCLARWVLT